MVLIKELLYGAGVIPARLSSEGDPPGSRCPPGMPSACRWRTGEALRAGGGQAQAHGSQNNPKQKYIVTSFSLTFKPVSS